MRTSFDLISLARTAVVATAFTLAASCAEPIRTEDARSGDAAADSSPSDATPQPVACGPCAPPNAVPTCADGGSCAIASCLAGFADCDHEASNGCEVATGDDEANCGRCGMACGAGTFCAAGTCTPAPTYEGLAVAALASGRGVVATVVQAPSASGVVAAGMATEYHRVAFELEETRVTARIVDGAATGDIWLAWPVVSYFDIDPADPTHEITDRPWNERSHVRMEFGRPVLGTDSLARELFLPSGSQLTWEGMAAPAHTEGGAEGYFDVDIRGRIVPGASDLCAPGSTCVARACPWGGDCAPAPIVVRLAFAREETHAAETITLDPDAAAMFAFRRADVTRRTWLPGDERREASTGGTLTRFDPFAASVDATGAAIPVASRAPRTVPVYLRALNGSLDDSTFDALSRALDGWNEGLLDAMTTAGATVPTGTRILVACHDPVRTAAPADPAPCSTGLTPETDGSGNTMLRARLGDPRRSSIVWVDAASESAPIAFGEPRIDPATGDVRGLNVVLWASPIVREAGLFRDLVATTPWDGRARARTLLARASLLTLPTDNGSFVANALSRVGTPAVADPTPARLARIAGSTTESQLVGSDFAITAGMPSLAWSEMTELEREIASPFRHRARDAFRSRRGAMQSFGYDFDDVVTAFRALRLRALMTDPAVRALAADALFSRVRDDIAQRLALHAIGGALGLRRYLGGSADAFHYPDRYWELRTAALAATQRFTGLNASTFAPESGSFDPAACAPGVSGAIRGRHTACPSGALSLDEVAGGITDLETSSVMDHGAPFHRNALTLGKYDRAALAFAIGHRVEVWTDLRPDMANTWRAQVAWANGAVAEPAPPEIAPEFFASGRAGFAAREWVDWSTVTRTPEGVLVDALMRPIATHLSCAGRVAACDATDAAPSPWEHVGSAVASYVGDLVDAEPRPNARIDALIWRERIRDDLERVGQSAPDAGVLAGRLAATESRSALVTSFADERRLQGVQFAARRGAAALLGVVGRPDAGAYVRTDPVDTMWFAPVLTRADVPASSATATVLPEDGRTSRSTIDIGACDASGCPMHLGGSFDRSVALELLGRSVVAFGSGGDLWAAGFGALMPSTAWLDAVGSLDVQRFAMHQEIDGSYGFRGLEPSAAPATLLRFAPGDAESLGWQAWTWALLGATDDVPTISGSRIYVLGAAEGGAPDSTLLATGTSDPSQLVRNGGSRNWLTYAVSTHGTTLFAPSYPRLPSGGVQDPGIGLLQASIANEAEYASCRALPMSSGVYCVYRPEYLATIGFLRQLHTDAGLTNLAGGF